MARRICGFIPEENGPPRKSYKSVRNYVWD